MKPRLIQLPLEVSKKVNSDNPNTNSMQTRERATKIIYLCPSTWEAVRELKQPGQTYDDVLRDLVRKETECRLIDEIE
jgi:hypothetical protein